jgi:hypothetical protein
VLFRVSAPSAMEFIRVNVLIPIGTSAGIRVRPP